MPQAIAVEPLPEEERRAMPETLVFGATLSDHMFSQHWHGDGGWREARVHPVADIQLHPAAAVLHYGQEIFEGMKAYRGPGGTVSLFRPEQNFRRFNASARRMVMPEVPEALHLEALSTLLRLDERWVPDRDGASLYIRPAMIASSPKLGLGAAADYIHFIITSPVGPYFASGFDPVSVFVSDTARRAVIGGVGDAKTGGNYAASLSMSEHAAKLGYTQVLWLDAIHGRYIEEVGAMNICFVYGGRHIATPALSGSILPGITRDSVLKLAPTLGYEVSEARLDIEEVMRDIDSGRITEVFGCGTAAVISPVGRLHFRDRDADVNGGETGPVARALFDALTGIQYGTRDDPFGWRHPIS